MKKILIILTLIIIQLLMFGAITVFADEQAPPTNLTVDEVNGQSIIGYTAEKGYYIRLKWTPPTSWRGQLQYYKLYYGKDGEAVQQYGGQIEEDETSIDIEQLEPGLVYHAYLKAVHEHYENGMMISTDTSITSNEILFMTDINLTVKPADTDKIEIEWNMINFQPDTVVYAVYVSESRYFSETSPLCINNTQIGDEDDYKPVKYINGKLIYIAKNLKAGTVYYIKIKPIIIDERVVHLDESDVVTGYTNILASITKVSADWWELEWQSVTNTNLGQDENIIYKIKRSVDGDLEKEVSATKDTNMFVVLPSENTYYRVQADVINQYGETIMVVSPEIYPIEEDIVAIPIVPDIVDQISNEDMEVGADSLKIVWRVPITITDEVDEDVVYDIWMLEDADDINNSAIIPIVTDFEPSADNYIYELIGSTETDKIIGYTYTITDLNPNSTYYLKMVAKKTFTISENGSRIDKEYSSEPALQVILTLPEGSINQPVALTTPPLKIKTEEIDGEEVKIVGSDSVALEWKNQWYEVWDDTDNVWEYITENELEQAIVQGDVYRQVKYDADIKFSVGYEEYTQDFDFTRLLENISTMPIQFTDIPNATDSDTVEFEVTGLNPNTRYVMWIRAYRSNSLKSALSDPVIVTTKPDNEISFPNPIIPEFNYKYEGDTYVELGWEMLDNHSYCLKYATQDDIGEAMDTIDLSADDLSEATYYRIENLEPDTIYYFWIKAKIQNDEEEILESEWSDSYIIKTSPWMSPDIPTGFGLKNIDEPIGKDYIFFNWNKVAGLEYLLEIGKYNNFNDAQIYEAGEVSEYKVEDLKSNTRYYARLRAYNPEKELYSSYTSYISIITLKSYDEYYSNTDSNGEEYEIIKPDLIEDEDDNQIGELNIAFDKTDMFIEQIYQDKKQDFIIDFSMLSSDDEIEKSETTISPRVLVALSQIKKRLILKNSEAELIIKPTIIKNEQLIQLYNKNPRCNVKIILEKVSNPSEKPTGSTFVSDTWNIAIKVDNDGLTIPITNINNGINIRIPYTTKTWYDKSTMSGYIYNQQDEIWVKVETVNIFDKLSSEGLVYADVPGNCNFSILKLLTASFTDISISPYYTDIKAITDQYNLKSLGDGLFKPNSYLTKDDAVKILLDIMDYNYDENYLEAASKAKITENINMQNIDEKATREETAVMITRIYELISGEKAESSMSLSSFKDVSSVNENLLPRVTFAVESGILDTTQYIIPKGNLTRANMMVMIKQMLIKAGRI